MPTRRASAKWEGGIKGKGTFTGESGSVNGDYSVGSRFADGGGSNPEELLAAAEAACFSMALSLALEKAGTPATSVETRAACTVEKVGDGYTITTMKLVVRARVPGADRDTFKDTAEATKSTCPVSRALMGNVQIDVDASLED